MFFPFGTRALILHLIYIDVHKIPHGPLCIKFPRHEFIFLHWPLHPSSSFLGLSIVDSLNLTKSTRRFKYYLISIDFVKIDARDVNYLSPSYDRDVNLPPPYGSVSMDVPKEHGHLWITWIRCVTATIGVQQKQ